MRAAYIQKHGKLNEILIGDLDMPKYDPNDVLIETEFAGLNHLDIFVVAGWPGLKLQFPHILGADASGVVKEIGANVTTVSVGDRVVINPGISCGKCVQCLSGNQDLCKNFTIKGEHYSGTFAEYFSIPELNVMKIPDNYPMDLAAAAPLTFLTAWSMLVSKARIKNGDFVCIQGGTGGIGTASIQIAKLIGAKVITTTRSSEKIQKLKNIGADFIINSTEMPDYPKYVYKELTNRRGIDHVIDCVGMATFNDSIKMLRGGGILTTCGATTGPLVKLNLNQVFWKQIAIKGSTMSNQNDFRAVMDLVLSNKLEPIIDRVFPLDSARQAEEYLDASQHFGKILLNCR